MFINNDLTFTPCILPNFPVSALMVSASLFTTNEIMEMCSSCMGMPLRESIMEAYDDNNALTSSTILLFVITILIVPIFFSISALLLNQGALTLLTQAIQSLVKSTNANVTLFFLIWPVFSVFLLFPHTLSKVYMEFSLQSKIELKKNTGRAVCR